MSYGVVVNSYCRYGNNRAAAGSEWRLIGLRLCAIVTDELAIEESGLTCRAREIPHRLSNTQNSATVSCKECFAIQWSNGVRAPITRSSSDSSTGFVRCTSKPASCERNLSVA